MEAPTSAAIPGGSSQPQLASVSSRSFRQQVLTQSLMSFFAFRVGVKTANARQSGASSHNVTTSSSDQNANSTAQGGSATTDLEMQTRKESKSDGSDTTRPSVTGSEPKEALESQRDKHDPFAGSVEGGIEYKSMLWW